MCLRTTLTTAVYREQMQFNSFWPTDTTWQHRIESILAQVMACCLTAPSHFLNQCWVLISEILWHPPEGDFVVNTQTIYPWYKFENYLSKMTATSPMCQWVKAITIMAASIMKTRLHDSLITFHIRAKNKDKIPINLRYSGTSKWSCMRGGIWQEDTRVVLYERWSLTGRHQGGFIKRWSLTGRQQGGLIWEGLWQEDNRVVLHERWSLTGRQQGGLMWEVVAHKSKDKMICKDRARKIKQFAF